MRLLLGLIAGLLLCASVHSEKNTEFPEGDIESAARELGAAGDLVQALEKQLEKAVKRVRKTEKAYKFLKGLRTKIDSLLANPSGSLRNEKARLILVRLHRDIDKELAKEPPDAMAHRLLHSGDPRS